MNVRHLSGVMLLVVTVAGCHTASQRYEWGDYDPALYSYYKDPAKVAELTASLEAVIRDSESNRAPVPPGIYAEYGYLQLQQGKAQDAARYFRQEEDHWPESKVFMDRMIQVALPSASTSSARSAAP